MKILKKKNINEEAEVLVNKQTLDLDKDSLTPTVDHEVTAILLSKEHNEESAKENIEASGIEEVAKEVVDEIQDPKKDTPAPKTPSLKPYTEAKLVVDRKELGALIKESVKAGRSYKIRRSLEEGFRYVFEDFEAEYPECYFVCHSDDDANNENGYFDTLEDAKAYAEANPEICCIFKVCDNEEEKVWSKVEECKETTNECSEVKEGVDVCPECGKSPCECEDKEGMKEDLEEEESFNLNEELYGALIPVILKFIDKGITENDLNGAFEFCVIHMKDDERVPESFFDKPANVESTEDKPLDEAIVAPVSEPGDNLKEDDEDKPEEEANVSIEGEETPEIESQDTFVADEAPAEAEVAPEVVAAAEVIADPTVEEDPEIEIDSIEMFEPTDEKAKSTMTTIKDAGEGAMFAFKDTLKDLFNLKIKVSDLQKLLSDSSDWLLDLLGFNGEHEEEIHPEEIPEEPVPVEEPEIVGGEFDEVAPVTDVSTIDINDFDDVEPVEYEEEEDKNFFVGD